MNEKALLKEEGYIEETDHLLTLLDMLKSDIGRV